MTDQVKLDNARKNLQEVKQDIAGIMRVIIIGDTTLRQNILEDLQKYIIEKNQFEKEKDTYEKKLGVSPREIELDNVTRELENLNIDLKSFINFKQGLKDGITDKEKQVSELTETAKADQQKLHAAFSERERQIDHIKKLIENAVVAPVKSIHEKTGLLQKELLEDVKIEARIDETKNRLSSCSNPILVKTQDRKQTVSRVDKEINALETKIHQAMARKKAIESMKKVGGGRNSNQDYYQKYIKYKKKYITLKNKMNQ